MSKEGKFPTSGSKKTLHTFKNNTNHAQMSISSCFFFKRCLCFFPIQGTKQSNSHPIQRWLLCCLSNPPPNPSGLSRRKTVEIIYGNVHVGTDLAFQRYVRYVKLDGSVGHFSRMQWRNFPVKVQESLLKGHCYWVGEHTKIWGTSTYKLLWVQWCKSSCF